MKKERRGRGRGRGQQRFATSFLAVGELDDDPRFVSEGNLRKSESLISQANSRVHNVDHSTCSHRVNNPVAQLRVRYRLSDHIGGNIVRFLSSFIFPIHPT